MDASIQLPTYQALLKSQQMLQEQGRLNENQVRNMATRIGRVLQAFGEEAVNELIVQHYEGNYDEEDALRRFRNLAYQNSITLPDGEDRNGLNTLVRMIEHHNSLLAGDTKAFGKSRVAVKGKTGAKVAEKTPELASPPAAAQAQATAPAVKAVRGLSDEEAWDEFHALWRTVIDAAPLPMERKALNQHDRELIHDSRQAFETFRRLRG
jgi:hypothetical protein